MEKESLWKRILSRLTFRNAPTSSGTVSRDPKAIQVKRVGYQLSSGGGGGRETFETPKVDLTVIATAIERDSYIAQAVMRYRELIFKSGWKMEGKNEQVLEYLKMRLEMIAIATSTPTEDLFQGVADDIVRYSNSFIVKARAKGGKGLPPGITAVAVPPAKDPIAGYFRLPPQTMEIGRDANGNITKYKQTPVSGGEAIEFNPQDIIHIVANRPVGESFGLPWLGSVIEDVRLLRKVEENVATLLYRHTFPLLSYTVGIAEPGYESTDEEIEALRAVIESIPTDGAFILPERHKIDPIDIKTIDAKPYLDYFENRVFTGLGMSAVDMGRGDTANRSTADAMSGMKADRVKGWQQQIQVQIDKFIIEELLVEGGFDPLANTEYDINFVFNEIEHETRIKTETHEIFKFEHNIQTFDETRKNLGMDPMPDEMRLHTNMFNKVTSSDATDNMQQPENQNGRRSGPRRPTESLKENFNLENDFQINWTETSEEINFIYDCLENECAEMIEKENEKMIKSIVNMSFEKIKTKLYIKCESYFEDGFSNALKDNNRKSAKRNKNGQLEKIKERTRKDISKWLSQLEENAYTIKEERKKEKILNFRSIFQSLKYKINLICKTNIYKSYNYGYVQGLISCGIKEYRIKESKDACNTCKESKNKTFDLGRFSSFDEIYIYDHIPPWHPNCTCEVKSKEGGDIL